MMSTRISQGSAFQPAALKGPGGPTSATAVAQPVAPPAPPKPQNPSPSGDAFVRDSNRDYRRLTGEGPAPRPAPTPSPARAGPKETVKNDEEENANIFIQDPDAAIGV
jgi:hypothetical protein